MATTRRKALIVVAVVIGLLVSATFWFIAWKIVEPWSRDPFKPRTDLMREYPHLRSLVLSVPVPTGVRSTGPLSEAINDGPGFTAEKFPEVSQEFATDLSCADLEAAWTAALTNAHIKFKVIHYPRVSGAAPDLIELRSGSPHLDISLGNPPNCQHPGVEAFDGPS